MKHTSHFEIHAHQTTHKLSRITMEKEKPPSATLDDEVKIDQVVSNSAPRSQEQETKPAKGGGQETKPATGGGWWSEEKKVAFMRTVESQKLTRGARTTNSDEFWREHVIPALRQDALTKDCADNAPASLKTRYNSLAKQLERINRAVQTKINQQLGKDGAVYKNLQGDFYSGKGEEEGRALVAQVYHDDFHEGKRREKPFVVAEYAKETCTSPLFEYFVTEYIVWEKPTGKTLNIVDLQLAEAKKRRNEKFAAGEERKTEKMEVEEARADGPRTVEKNEQGRNTKKTKVAEKKSLKSDKEIEIANEVLLRRQETAAARQESAAAKRKVAEALTTKNKIEVLSKILESPFTSDEAKEKALRDLTALF